MSERKRRCVCMLSAAARKFDGENSSHAGSTQPELKDGACTHTKAHPQQPAGIVGICCELAGHRAPEGMRLRSVCCMFAPNIMRPWGWGLFSANKGSRPPTARCGGLTFAHSIIVGRRTRCTNSCGYKSTDTASHHFSRA